MSFFLGIGKIITKAHGIVGLPEKFLFIGNGTISIIPIPIMIFIGCVILSALVLNKSSLGLSIYMIGSNPLAARFSGINNNTILIKTYMISGLLAGISSLIMISRVNSAKAGYGSSYLLQSILIIIIGGVDPSGGHGTISGVVMSIIILQMLQSGFNILAVSPFVKNIIWGLMLLIIMVINFISASYQIRPRKLKSNI
jgi:simple sugar transport system permease protein